MKLPMTDPIVIVILRTGRERRLRALRIASLIVMGVGTLALFL